MEKKHEKRNAKTLLFLFSRQLKKEYIKLYRIQVYPRYTAVICFRKIWRINEFGGLMKTSLLKGRVCLCLCSCLYSLSLHAVQSVNCSCKIYCMIKIITVACQFAEY